MKAHTSYSSVIAYIIIGEEVNTYIIVDTDTRKIECTSHLKGRASRDKDGNIYVLNKQGIGFHGKE